MARGKKQAERISEGPAAPAVPQPITETIEKNYMPYVVTVVKSRAIPEIDGFKPSHRKLLYTMYKKGLLKGPRIKSANVVGETMQLNPHGTDAIYETLVRLTRGNEALMHPFIDSKGSFGKHYSSDMDYAAMRYTEVKLDNFASELFRGISSDAVDMVDNYDGTQKEPVLLPTSFPNILVTPNMGIAVGMASKICSFNLGEVCDGAIQMLRFPETTVDQMLDIIKAPDFSGGANLIYDREALREIYLTGHGSVKLRARYEYDKSNNCIEIIQIPYSTTIELIMKKLTEKVKEGKLKEITDFRDEIDLSGFKLTLDVRRGVDPDKLMAKLFKMTPLEDSFDCNFNVLIDGTPRQLGLIDILAEWIKFRVTCVKRELTYEVERKKEKLHLLLGLGKILLDIDKAIKIVRETAKESDVVPNLMAGFNIDKIQAEYVAEIKLRNLNREYILNRIKDIEDLRRDIENTEKTIGSEKALKSYIAAQLKEIKSKYAKPRFTQLIYEDDIGDYEEEETVENYNVKILLSIEGYFKKITLQSLRGNDEQKYKEGDSLRTFTDAENKEELIFFSDMGQVYKSRVSDFDTTKAAALGDFIPAKLSFDDGERVIAMKNLTEYPEDKYVIFIFENGKGVRVPLSAYMTKSNRRKLSNAYSTASPIVSVIFEEENTEIMLKTDAGRGAVIKSSLIPVKTTRTSGGVSLIKLKAGGKVTEAITDFADKYDPKRYRKTKIPAPGTLLEEYDISKNQIKLDD